MDNNVRFCNIILQAIKSFPPLGGKYVSYWKAYIGGQMPPEDPSFMYVSIGCDYEVGKISYVLT